MESVPFTECAGYISKKFGVKKYDLSIVLGSGLGGFTKHLKNRSTIQTTEIPDFPSSSVAGHRGEIVAATIGDKKILAFSGRVHFYETRSTTQASVTSIVSHLLGIKKIILTNAAGILNSAFSPGSLMLIEDQINLTGYSVLADLGASLTDLNPVYDRRLLDIASAASRESGVAVEKGTYIGLTGPTYETTAEVKMYRRLGGDSVGMSTIHEAMFARYVGMEVLGISCLTNYSTGITSKKLSHSEVTQIGAKVDMNFSALLTSIINHIED